MNDLNSVIIEGVIENTYEDSTKVSFFVRSKYGESSKVFPLQTSLRMGVVLVIGQRIRCVGRLDESSGTMFVVVEHLEVKR